MHEFNADERVTRTALSDSEAAVLAAGNRLDEPVALVDERPGPEDRLPRVDLHELFANPPEAGDWLIDHFLAKGRGHLLWAKAGSKKSLFTLAKMIEALEAGCLVLYLDLEMTKADLHERLSDMGVTPDTVAGLDRLHYVLLPDLPPLDTADGGAVLHAKVDALLAQYPERHLVVVIDTIGRAVEGEESSNDTYFAFERHTGRGLKRRSVTWARLDHGGHNADHPRGASGKNDDVDLVWQIVRTGNGVKLVRGKSRVSFQPGQAVFRETTEHPLRYELVRGDWQEGARDVANVLDRLGLPLDVSTRKAEQAVRAAGIKSRNDVIRDGVKLRRWEAEKRAGRTSANSAPRDSGRTPQEQLEMDGAHPGAQQGAPEEVLRPTVAPPYGGAPGADPHEPIGDDDLERREVLAADDPDQGLEVER